jgi:hypothetical protein
MLSTGIRTDVGVKVYGQNLDTINVFAQKVRSALQGIEGIKDLYVEPITGGKYIDINIKRDEIGRYGLSIDDVNTIIESALGGMKLTTTVEGRRRFSVNARFGQDFRNNLQAIKQLQVQTMSFGPIPLEAVADIKITEGPPMISSENALLRGTVLFNVRDRDLAGTVEEARANLEKMIGKMSKGYFVEWSGQYENLIRSEKTLKLIMPLVLLIIFMSMCFAFHPAREAFFSLILIPFALIGGAFMITPTTTVYANEGGYITSIAVQEGEYVSEGATIVQLADLSTLWAEAQVYTSQFSQLNEKASVTVRLPDIGNEIQGKLEFVNPEINADKRINLIRVTIPNKDNRLTPGMSAYVVIKGQQQNTLSLPADAVIRDGKGASVWVKTGKNTFKNKMVTVGMESKDRIEITYGLAVGEAVVTSGAYLINSEYIFKKGASPNGRYEDVENLKKC